MTSIETRECNKCYTVKPIDEFARRTEYAHAAYRSECKRCQLDKIMEWRNRNRVKVNAHARAYVATIEGRAKNLWHGARTRASTKKQEFKLPLAHVLEGISRGYCIRTGLPFDLSTGIQKAKKVQFNPLAPSIDKIDPHGIYEPSNVQYVCNWYNFAKAQVTDEMMLFMCRMVIFTNADKPE